MKTIPEWFKLLPCAQRRKAMAYIYLRYKWMPKQKFESFKAALSSAFVFEETKQGFDYWYKISQNAEIN